MTAAEGSARCPRCGAELPAGRLEFCPACIFDAKDEPVVIGGALELHEELGRGGMGAVFKARHLSLNRFVAVKFLPEELAKQPEFQSRFEREARALALLNHPNIVSVHDFGREEQQSYLVMEYVEGGSLTKRIPMPLEEAIDAAIQICDALDYAHKQGVVHRDIKPANILIDSAGRVKVSDFGLARIVRPGAKGWTVTTPDVTVGTPHFMAPEALSGAPPDPRMDIYSLGVLLYELVTGKLPMGDFAPAPQPLQAIVKKALAPEPAQRYASAADMRRDLQAAIAHRTPPLAAGELEPHELNWLRAVALSFSVASAVALWALLECIRPRVIERKDYDPLTMLGTEDFDAGHIISRARFATWPILAALAAFTVAILGYGLLRRHWRSAGLEQPNSGAPVRESKWVFLSGLAALLLYAARKTFEYMGLAWSMSYLPVVGGAILTAMLFFAWIAMLQAWRTSRPLTREPLLWLGLVIGVLPPAVVTLTYLKDWTP